MGVGSGSSPHKREHFLSPLGMQVQFLQPYRAPLLASRDLIIGAKFSFPELALSSLGVTVEFKSGSHPNVGLSKVTVWLCLGTAHNTWGTQGSLLIKCTGG